MLLTRIWAVLLAVLATGCLAGMFLLSAGQSGDFTDADRDAVRAVTEAGVAALTAEISASTVQQVNALVLDDSLREALARDPKDDDDDEVTPLSQVLAEATEALRVRTKSNITVAVVNGSGKIVASNGLAEASMADVIATEAFRSIPPTEDGQFSITLGDEIHVAKVTRSVVGDQRLVGVDKLNLGAGSLLRRVLGSETPAGIVRDGKLVGEIIGDQPIGDEIEALAAERSSEVPSDGSSNVFAMGSGLDKRIGAMGRVPGPAGKGDNGAILIVMSRETAAASQQDIAAAISEARRKGVRVNWPILVGLLLLSGALAVYLPYLEAIGPMRRLAQEFNALAVGQQHQVFHDRYGGTPGQTARAAAGAYEALRQAFLAELDIDDDGVAEEEEPAPRRTRTSRRRRLTRAHQKLGEGQQESSATNTGSRRRAKTGVQPAAEDTPAPAPAATPEAAAPPAFAAPAPSAVPAPAPVPVPVPAPRHTAPAPAVPQPAAPPPAAPAPVPAPPAATPSPPEAEPPEEEFGEIFEEFVQVKQACGEPTANLTYERFAAKLRKNERDLKAKRPDIKRVQFTVYVKDGKAALKAKVIK
ncbi:MAG: MXAN_5187 family protein [Nannocystales bacterium]